MVLETWQSLAWVGNFRLVAAICPRIVVWPELGTVAVPTLESHPAVIVAVAVALSNSARLLWSAAVAATTLDYRAARAAFVGTGTKVTGS